MRILPLLLALVGFTLSVHAQAAAPSTKAKDDKGVTAVHAELAKTLKGLTLDQVRATPIAGIYEVDLSNGSGYVTGDGKYLIKGDLFEVSTRANLTQARRGEQRRMALAQLDEKQLIVFAPETPKHTITVFTDVECGYCRKLHSEIAKLNELGIKVRYAAYPRNGPGTEDWTKMEAVWCAADPRDALTRAKKGENIDKPQSCKSAEIVKAQYELGQKFGMKGTPLIVLEDGTTIDGYMPAQQLAEQLDQRSQAVAAAKPPAP